MRMLVLAALSLALVLACGGGAPQEAVDPYAEVYRTGGGGEGAPAEAPTVDLSTVALVGAREREMLATLVAGVEAEQKEKEEPGGLQGQLLQSTPGVPRVGATRSPEETPSGDGSGSERPVVAQVAGSTPLVPVVTATPEVEVMVVHSPADCGEDFREMIARDRGLVGRWFDMSNRALTSQLREREREFDVEYVMGLNESFLASRPDCAELGWAPVFSYGAECSGKTVGTRDATVGGFYGRFDGASLVGNPRKGDFVWYPTQQVGSQVMMHFERMPLRDGAGCWTGDIRSGRWIWQTADASEYGYFHPDSRYCNASLLGAAERIHGQGWSAEQWMLEVSTYLRDNREDCPRHRLRPILEAHDGCVAPAAAAVDAGGVAVHWDERYVLTGRPVCWVGTVPEDSQGLAWEGYDAEGNAVGVILPGA